MTVGINMVDYFNYANEMEIYANNMEICNIF